MPHPGGSPGPHLGASRPRPRGCIPACTEVDTPPPQQTTTAVVSTHPTGMHSCYRVKFNVINILIFLCPIVNEISICEKFSRTFPVIIKQNRCNEIHFKVTFHWSSCFLKAQLKQSWQYWHSCIVTSLRKSIR